MRVTVITCDRHGCEKEIKTPTQDGVTVQISKARAYDLCAACWAEFEEWLRHSKTGEKWP